MSSLIEYLDTLENDKQIWEWVIENNDKDIRIEMDNDTTYLVDSSVIPDDLNDGEEYYIEFEYSIGNSPGIEDLLDAIGVKWCYC